MANRKNNSNSQKGNKNKVENYRPVASLCSTSKIFERLILNKINNLVKLNAINLVGKQHGFTKNKSTATAGLLIQSLNNDNGIVCLHITLTSP